MNQKIAGAWRRRTAALVVAGLVAAAFPAAANAETAAEAMTSCWRNTTLAGAAANCDAPQAVVDATYRACSQQELAWHSLMIQAGGVYGGAMANNIYLRVKQNSRATLLGLVAKTRAEKGLCK